MNISLEWLEEFLPGAASLDPELAGDALMRAGFPIESIGRKGPKDDVVLDVEITSNRGDCLSHVGVARELAAVLHREFRHAQAAASESRTAASSAVSVRIDATTLCPHYTARVLRNVKVGPSPEWMVRRLEAIGLRSINNIVDVTNYVMFEMGQPLHAFDLDAIDGAQIIVRVAAPGEKIKSIDGHERSLTPGMLVIADAQRPIALAGVMGGLDSEVSSKTVNILLESARFDPLSVRKTARGLAMKSDSSYRFERGIDPTLPVRASLRAAQLMLDVAGGELLAGVVEAGSADAAPKHITLRLAQLRRILGIDVPVEKVIDAFTRLQLAPQREDTAVRVTVPSFRLDLNIERDLIEEVARMIGYDAVPVRDEISIRVVPPEPVTRTIETIAQALVAGGYFEAVTFSFVTDALADDFIPTAARGLARVEAATRKADARLRPSILPGLLEAIRRNEAAGTSSAKLFEIGSTFWHGKDGTLVETRRLSLAGGSDLRDTRGQVEAILSRLNAMREVKVVPDDHAGFAKGTAGRIFWGGESIGHLGLVDRAIADKLGLREVPCAAEIDLLPLLENAQHIPQLRAVPRLPAIARDLTLDISEQTPFDAIINLIDGLKLPHLESTEFVTTYRGKQLAAGTKSVTIQLIFRSPTETLTTSAVDEAVARVVESAKRQLNASLRS